MQNSNEANWLLEIFLQYQEEIDFRRRASPERFWLEEAIQADEKIRDAGADSASSIDAA